MVENPAGNNTMVQQPPNATQKKHTQYTLYTRTQPPITNPLTQTHNKQPVVAVVGLRRDV